MNAKRNPKPLRPQVAPHSLAADEGLFLRLFRCLPLAYKTEILSVVGKQAMRRYHVDPHHGTWISESSKELQPEQIEDFDGRSMASWPGDWPDRLIDLDDMGDAGAFLDEAIPDGAVAILFGTSDNDESVAESLTEAFVAQAEKNSVPLPSAFGASTEDMFRDITDDFVRFLRVWRENVLQTIEKQALKEKDE